MKRTVIGLFALLFTFNISSHGAQGTGEDESWGFGGAGIVKKDDTLLDEKSNDINNDFSDKRGMQGISDAKLYGHGTTSNETVVPLDTIDNAQRSNSRMNTISSLKMDMENVSKRKNAAHEEYRKAGYPLLKLRMNADVRTLSPRALSLRKTYLDLNQEYKDLGKELAHLRAIFSAGE